MSQILNSTGCQPSTVGLSADAALRAALISKGLRYVGIRGNPRASTCFLGEAPGEKEDAKGLPFVGPSGYLLDQMLKEAGFNSQQVWFSNPYKTRPPDNKMDRLPELGIPNQLFLDQFFEELNTWKPTIIVTCGKTPTQILCPETKPKLRKKQDEKKDGFGNWRGSLLTSPLLNWPHYIIPTYHPAYVLRNYDEREIVIFILTRAFEEYSHWKLKGSIRSLPTRKIITSPSYEEAGIFLERCINSTAPVSIDIELLRRKVPYTVSFALNPWEAVSMSFWNYPMDQLVRLWRQIDVILSTKKQIGQNYTSFDAHWLRALGFSVNLSLVEDTLIRHHILWPELRHKLEFQTMQYTREPYYKEEGHGWTQKDGLDKLMKYNCKDTLVTYEIFNAQEAEFADRK